MSSVRGRRRVPGPAFARFYIAENQGDCLDVGRFSIIDREGEIRAGDLFSFSVRDWREAFGHYGPRINGITKRFRGVNHERAVLECDCDRPAVVIHIGLTNLLWAHRIVATAPTRWAAMKLLWRLRFTPEQFD
jgi:hypothetical protein